MQPISKPSKKTKKPLLLTDDTLKERSGSPALFTEKIEKATQIMSLVRAQQSKQVEKR